MLRIFPSLWIGERKEQLLVLRIKVNVVSFYYSLISLYELMVELIVLTIEFMHDDAGSCWAFSAAAAIEGINQIVTGNLTDLSEQQLIDCDTTSNNGCDGGNMDRAFAYIVSSGGLHKEEDYPYTMKQDTCQWKPVNSNCSKNPSNIFCKVDLFTVPFFFLF